MTEGRPLVTRRHPIARSITALNIWAAVAASGAAAIVMVALVIAVLWRGVFNESLPGLIELVELLMIFVVYLGLAHAEHTRAHVRMTIVTSRLPPTWRRRVLIVSRLVACIGALVFVIGTGQRAIDATIAGEYRMGLMNFPIWPARLTITLGFVLLLLEQVLQLIDTVTGSPHDLFPENETVEIPRL